VVKQNVQSSQRDGIKIGGSINSLVEEVKIQETVLSKWAVSRVSVKYRGSSTSDTNTGHVHGIQSKLQ
jgi:hypothetical protein